MKKFFQIDPLVDGAGLTPLQFRLVGHLAHLAAGDGRIESSISNMAMACGLFRGTVKIGLRELKLLNIVVEEPGNGKVPIRRLNPPSVWKVDRVLKTHPVRKQPGVENGQGLHSNQPPGLTQHRSLELKKGQTW
jgi:hypothetical protein